jgi:hypothetical protein
MASGYTGCPKKKVKVQRCGAWYASGFPCIGVNPDEPKISPVVTHKKPKINKKGDRNLHISLVLHALC